MNERTGAAAAAPNVTGHARHERMPGMKLDREDWPTAAFLVLARALARYHRHRVLHLGRLGRLMKERRRVVLVGNHALDVVDPFLFIAAMFERYGRVPRFVGHKSWFRLPVLRQIAARYRIVQSRSMTEAGKALRDDGMLMVFPGGVSEAALRVYRDEPYRLKWQDRVGFLRLALAHEAEIVFVAAVGNDEMYYQSRLATPQAVIDVANAEDGARYRGSPLRLGLLGPHLLPAVFPLPAQLTHVVSPPLELGDREGALRDPEALAARHRAVWTECQAFLDAAVARRARSADLTDRALRAGQHLLQRLGL